MGISFALYGEDRGLLAVEGKWSMLASWSNVMGVGDGLEGTSDGTDGSQAYISG